MQDAERYYCLHPLLEKLFDYVATHDLSQVPAGRVTIQGDDLFINVTDATLLPREERKMEVHRAYLDVHIPLSCAEEFGTPRRCPLPMHPSTRLPTAPSTRNPPPTTSCCAPGSSA